MLKSFSTSEVIWVKRVETESVLEQPKERMPIIDISRNILIFFIICSSMPIHHSCFKNPFEGKYLDLKWENGFPYSNYYADRFFQNDALAEIKNIFIEPNQIRERIEAGGQIHIGELGFGLGLNFFVTAKFWHENNQNSDSLKSRISFN